MASITLAQQAFINRVAPWIVYYAPKYNVKCPSAVIAQAIHETGWGKDGLSPYNNFFGLKCGTLWKGKSVNLTTQEEYTKGTLTTIKDNFRVYDSIEEGVKGYFEFLFKDRTRYDNLKGVKSPKKYLENIKADGYATGSEYVKNCMDLVNQYTLTIYDSMAPERPVYSASKVVSVMEAWIGRKESDGTHKQIVDIYNAFLKIAVRQHKTLNYKMTYSDSWCAAGLSAAFFYAGMDELMPVECSCPRMIEIAKKMGIWVEDESVTPEKGWIVLYDWGDSGSGDNKGTPDHVGQIQKVTAKQMKVIECNYSDSVKVRTIGLNSKGIRGYIRPKYESSSAQAQIPAEPVKTPVSGQNEAKKDISALTPTSAASFAITGSSKPCRDEIFPAVVTTQSGPLNVRQEPGIGEPLCQTFGPIPRGATVSVCDAILGSDDAVWYLVKYEGKYGFSMAKYLVKRG